MIKNLLLCFCLLISFLMHSKENETFGSKTFFSKKDSIESPQKLANKRARRAMLFSTILPGLGQAYNKRFWKIPLIYGAGAGLSYFFLDNQKQYKSYSDALVIRYDDDASTIDDYENLSDANIVNLKKQYKKRRDFCAIGIGAVYLINIIDANVDAHLRKFDEQINENLSLSIRPGAGYMNTFNKTYCYTGLKLKLNF